MSVATGTGLLLEGPWSTGVRTAPLRTAGVPNGSGGNGSTSPRGQSTSQGNAAPSSPVGQVALVAVGARPGSR